MSRSVYTESDDAVRLIREGRDPVEVLVTQVSPQTVARIFSVSFYDLCSIIVTELIIYSCI